MIALLVACTTVAAPPPATPTKEDALIHVEADQAMAHGLPPAAFQVDPGASLSGRPFPEQGVYLTLSGPPGGLLLLQVYPKGEGGADALAGMVRAHYDKPWWQPLELGDAATVELAGGPRAAVPFTTGQGPAQAVWCAALLPEPGLLVVFGHASPGPATCEQVAAHPLLAPALASLRTEQR